MSVPLVRHEVVGAVLDDEPTQALTHIQDTELCPQIHQTVGGGRAGQSNNAADSGSDLQDGLKPLCVVVLERGQFVNHDHIEGERDAAFLNKPLHIFTVDNINIGGSHQGSFAFCFCADSHGADEVLEVIPLIDFSRPCVPRYTQRCNHQNPMNLEAVKQKVADGCEGDACFAKAHVQKDGGNGMGLDVVDGVCLVIMWFVSHQGYLRSALRYPGHRP